MTYLTPCPPRLLLRRPCCDCTGTYEDEIFMESIVKTISDFDASAGPLFAYVAWHNVHAPLQVSGRPPASVTLACPPQLRPSQHRGPPQVPDAYLRNFSFIDDEKRRLYAAKVNYMVRRGVRGRRGCVHPLWPSPFPTAALAGHNDGPRRRRSQGQGPLGEHPHRRELRQRRAPRR